MGEILVKNLGKAYKQYPTHLSRLFEWFSPFGKSRHTLKWAVKDVSFHIHPGGSVGIIGANGAGKSTLLKMITGTTQPTTGSVKMGGRVAALLELGMGFHPDFTGRQNVLMAGQLLGYSIREIEHLMPEIEAFAEIGPYIDLPIRVYSSGMQVRLAFSIATAVRPDILIVDEALSVGDAKFQHKSFARINEFRQLGTTLLIVSHDVQAILSVCDSAILLDAGNMVKQGDPESVLDYYNALTSQKSNINVSQEFRQDDLVRIAYGTGEAEIELVTILNVKGKAVETIEVGEKITLKVVARATVNLPSLALGYIIKDRLGQPIYGTNTYLLGMPSKSLLCNQRIEFELSFIARLGVGCYAFTVALHNSTSEPGSNYAWIDRAIFLNVVNAMHPKFMGIAWIEPEWNEARL